MVRASLHLVRKDEPVSTSQASSNASSKASSKVSTSQASSKKKGRCISSVTRLGIMLTSVQQHNLATTRAHGDDFEKLCAILYDDDDNIEVHELKYDENLEH